MTTNDDKNENKMNGLYHIQYIKKQHITTKIKTK